MYLPLVQYQAGDTMNALWMGGYANRMTLVLFIPQQGILPGSLREQILLGHLTQKEVLHQDF